MKEVYLVEYNDYEGSSVMAVLSKESDAQALAEQYGDGYSADEWILDAMKGAYKRTVYGYQNNPQNLVGKHWTYSAVLPPKAKVDINYDPPNSAYRYDGKILFCARSLVNPAHAEKLAKKAVADLLKKEKHEQAKQSRQKS